MTEGGGRERSGPVASPRRWHAGWQSEVGEGHKLCYTNKHGKKRNSKKSFFTCEELPTPTFSTDAESTFGVVDGFVVGRS